MSKRIGIICMITGIVLLLKPNFDFDQIMMTWNYMAVKYWPVLLIFVGFALQPRSKSRKRQRNKR